MPPLPTHLQILLAVAMASSLLSAAPAVATRAVVLRGHTSWVNTAVMSPDGRLVATGGNDGAIGIWQVDGTLLHRISLPRPATPMGEGSLLAHLGVPVNAVAFDPSGRWLAAGAGDGAIHLISVAEGRITGRLREQSGQVNALCWLRDGRLLAGGLDGYLTLWDVARREVVTHKVLFHFPIQQIALAPDGRRVAVCAMESRIKVASLPDLEVVQVLRGHKDVVYSVDWSRSGRYLVSGSNDRTVLLWDLQEGGRSRILWQDDEPVYAVAFAPDSATVAIAPRGSTIDLLTIPEGDPAGRLTGHTADICTLSFPQPGLLLSASRDATARIWRWGEGGEAAVPR